MNVTLTSVHQTSLENMTYVERLRVTNDNPLMQLHGGGDALRPHYAIVLCTQVSAEGEGILQQGR